MLIETAANFVITPITFVTAPIWKCAKSTFSKASASVSGSTRWKPPSSFTIPCGGLHRDKATALYFSIKQSIEAESTEEDAAEIAEAWLQCLVAGQYMSDSLLFEMRVVQHHMDFWQERMRSGGHQMFFAISQGPMIFLKSVKNLLGVKSQHGERQLIASHRVEQRIVMLRRVRATLAQALGDIHSAGKLLHINKGDAPILLDSDNVRSDNPTVRVTSAVFDCSNRILGITQYLDTLQQEIIGDEKPNASASVRLSLSHIPMFESEGSDAKPRRPILMKQKTLKRSDLTDALETLATWRSRVSLDMKYIGHRPANCLNAATQAARKHTRRHLVELPEWSLSPSPLQRHWLKWGLEWAFGLFVFRFMVVRSPLCGSNELQRMGTLVVSQLTGGIRDNVIRPLSKLQEEFLETFQARNSTVSSGDLVASRASLQRMLEEFSTDVAHKTPESLQGSSARGMDIMMHHYEDELKRPLRSVLSGTLPRSLLIQVQKVKVDVESAMLELDQILRSNELTIAMVAALPAVLVAAVAVYLAARMLLPTAPNLEPLAAPCRLRMTELERAIEQLRSATDDSKGTPNAKQVLEEEGMVLLSIAWLKGSVGRLYTQQNMSALGSQGFAEWRSIQADLDYMASSLDGAANARVAARMHRGYSIFNA